MYINYLLSVEQHFVTFVLDSRDRVGRMHTCK